MVYSAYSLESHVTSGEISRYIPGCRDVSRYFPGGHMTPRGKKKPMQACKYTTCAVHLAKAGRGTPYRKGFPVLESGCSFYHACCYKCQGFFIIHDNEHNSVLFLLVQ